ncbi:MAG: hypothetical protein EAX96_04185 [Candidatus Lokiarchaeota archaeon]|nr:hypothetical protein [Candidatus Lokiarchaeota archaeon]
MVWKSNISTDEANELIKLLSENVRKSISKRAVIASQLFPVSMYICVACQQLYEQSFEFNAFKNMVERGGVDPGKIGPKCKTVGSILNGLAFQSMAMLYLHGRGQCIYDWGGAEYEPEEKKEETKFILDIFRHLNPNYRNDSLLLVDQSPDKNMRVIDNQLIENLRSEMIEANLNQVKKFKKTIALITNYGFLDKCECRMGIFEHGPYKLDTGELLLFKEFQFMLNQIKGSPIPNLILAYQLKNMKSLEFNDWGTLFADPSDFSDHVTALGMWTHELILPGQIEYPNRLGKNTPISWEILDEVGKYSQKALEKLYLKVIEWDFERRCLSGARLYTNWIAAFGLHGNTMNINLKTPEMTRSYIPIFQKYPDGAHPFMNRFKRPDKEQLEDPSYYLLTE